MKKRNNSLQNNTEKVLPEHLVRVVTNQGAKCFRQGKTILEKLKSIDDSVEIIAREMARQAKVKR